jgi:hypothetical protein
MLTLLTFWGGALSRRAWHPTSRDDQLSRDAPDIAATFVRIGARTVRVHGICVARYAKLLAAFTQAVKLS